MTTAEDRADAARTDPSLEPCGVVSGAVARHVGGAAPPVALIGLVLAGYVVMVAVLVAVGEIVVHADVLAGLRGWDDDVTTWLAAHRSAWLDTVTGLLSRVADTLGVVVCALVIEAVLAVQRRWWAMLLVPIALGLELATFLTVNAIVGRDRPAVPRLGSEPSTSSFPSGHTAATVVVWGAVVVLFGASAAHRRSRAALWIVVVVAACAVGSARVYRGMHHPSDVVAGGLMGATALAVTVLAVRVAVADARSRRLEPAGVPAEPVQPGMPMAS